MNGARPTSHREIVQLPMGYEDTKSGQTWTEAEVRAVAGGDELFIGTSPEYNRNPNDLVYKTLLLARCIVRLGPKSPIALEDVRRLHAQDLRALEYAIYRLTYGAENVPEPDGPTG